MPCFSLESKVVFLLFPLYRRNKPMTFIDALFKQNSPESSCPIFQHGLPPDVLGCRSGPLRPWLLHSHRLPHLHSCSMKPIPLHHLACEPAKARSALSFGHVVQVHKLLEESTKTSRGFRAVMPYDLTADKTMVVHHADCGYQLDRLGRQTNCH